MRRIRRPRNQIKGVSSLVSSPSQSPHRPAVAAAVWCEREGAFQPEVWLPAGVVTRDRPITIFFIWDKKVMVGTIPND